jgi:hypothetical protein
MPTCARCHAEQNAMRDIIMPIAADETPILTVICPVCWEHLRATDNLVRCADCGHIVYRPCGLNVEHLWLCHICADEHTLRWCDSCGHYHDESGDDEDDDYAIHYYSYTPNLRPRYAPGVHREITATPHGHMVPRLKWSL